uniref:Uncharacterized protein n=1 Tax=Rhizophora mucronata TaxID=61149 RepID=A0A2P2M9I8_RHIMU
MYSFPWIVLAYCENPGIGGFE